MNFENQGVIKRLADQYGPENLAVVLGNGEASGVEVFAETVTEGDPSYAGPLAGVALKIPVYHVLEEEVMAVVPEDSGRKAAAVVAGHRCGADAAGPASGTGETLARGAHCLFSFLGFEPNHKQIELLERR